MSKFYAVKGKENKIFTDWNECQAFISENKGSGNKYKSFHTEEEAVAFLEDRDYYAERLNEDLSLGFAVAFTDGSFEEGENKYSYGVVAVSPSGEKRQFSGVGSDERFLSSRNIVGEVDGVLTAVKWAFLNGYKKLKIYHDYEGLSAWANGRWGASSPVALYYVKEFEKYKGVVDVVFAKVKGHSNHKYNEIVDDLAKQALFNGKILSLVGNGYKISGNYFYEDFISWLNKKAPKAKIFERLDGTGFILGEEKLCIYPQKQATSIVSNGWFLLCLSACYFWEKSKKSQVNRLIERCFSVEIDQNEEVCGIGVARAVLKILKDNYAPALIFALFEIENEIKKSLGGVDKISPYFVREDERFVLKSDHAKKIAIENAYCFFYEYRTNYFNLQLTYQEVSRLIEKAYDLLKAL
ncbi:MAG: ribonuclease H family protein [Clostridia bacterium]|nr:ribonuclease H family protein [Clostridia bacterium]